MSETSSQRHIYCVCVCVCVYVCVCCMYVYIDMYVAFDVIVSLWAGEGTQGYHVTVCNGFVLTMAWHGCGTRDCRVTVCNGLALTMAWQINLPLPPPPPGLRYECVMWIARKELD